jgi:hypothetical protein
VEALLSSASAVVLAALLLAARVVAERYGLARPSVEAILTATGASRSRAYELMARLAAMLPALAAAPGRPPKPPVASSPGDGVELTRAVLEYVMRHPGCVDCSGQRQRYSDRFRRFVIDLCAAQPSVLSEPIARAIAVPLGTLKDWLHAPAPREPEPPDEATTPPAEPSVQGPWIQTVLSEWRRWNGSLVDFCEHVRRDLSVPFGRDLIRHILEAEGLRKTARRDGEHRPDEIALRGAFRTYFPGAQWVGDGLQLPIMVDGQRLVFNVELDVDAHTGSFVGTSVRDAEDGAAVAEAFRSGTVTTGAPPLALLLDNRPSNHTPEVDAVLGSTIRIRATPERPQNKAHVEGAFGLFSRVLPDLVVDTTLSARELGRALVRLVVNVWARASNRRPRRDRGGRSRAELYADAPTEEQIEAARLELRALAERQERARRTLEARRRPEVLALLDDHFARLDLLDPKRHIRVAIAGYPVSAIVDAIAVYDRKLIAKTLPEGVDARYLLGIVRNITTDAELEGFAERLYDLRVEARDRMLAPLHAERDAVCADTNVTTVTNTCVDRAVETTSQVERTFWLDALAGVLRALPEPERKERFLWAGRRIQATYALPARERQQAIRFLGDRLLPLP